jgi:[ribosomal protein S18]-alanine N-acetyltransferase
MNAVIKPLPWQPGQPGQRCAMTAADVDAVLAVEQSAYSFPWSRGNFVDSLAAGYSAELLITRDHGARVVSGYFIAMTGVDELHLLNITIAPAWQGQGHGSRLLDDVQALARQQKLSQLWLEVRQSNQRARALYRRYGFEEVGLRPRYYPAAGAREDAVVMRMDLRTGACA